MKTADLCKRQVVTAPPAMPLPELARLMRANHVGSVVVTQDGGRKPVGIVTDRDIVMEVVAPGLDAATMTAGDIMTGSPVVAGLEDDAMWVLKTMRDRGVRRIPVVDENGDLAGILAFDDLMQHVGTTLNDFAQVIGTERLVEAWRRN